MTEKILRRDCRQVKCQHCGTGNPDTAKYCRKCGKPIIAERSDVETFIPVKPVVHNDTVCPHCGKQNCQPTTRSITKIKSSGYSWGSGCCGMLLMGPFGLLCGLCGTGSKIDSRNETVWICKNCGREHLSQKSALDKAQTSVASYAMTILAIALFLSIWYHGGGLIWLVPLAWAFSPILAWSILDDELSKELGYSFKEILPTEVSVTTYLLIAEAATILVLLFGGPVLENILAE